MSRDYSEEQQAIQQGKNIAIGGGAKVRVTEQIFPNVTQPPRAIDVPKWVFVVLCIYLLGSLFLKIIGQVNLNFVTGT